MQKDSRCSAQQTKDETETLRASYRHSETETITQTETHGKKQRSLTRKKTVNVDISHDDNELQVIDMGLSLSSYFDKGLSAFTALSSSL